jgi:integrase
MARHIEGPWYRSSKGTWYATLNGKSVSLGVKGEENRQEATKAWHKLMAGDSSPPPPKEKLTPEPAPQPVSEKRTDATVKEVVDAFLAAKKGTIKSQTHYVYGCLLKHVTDAFGTLTAKSLTADAFGKWLHALLLSVSSKAGVAGATMTAFKWAGSAGLIPTDPLKAFRKPAKASRGAKAVVTAETHAKLIEAAHPALRLLLTLLHETGARPSELTRLTAADVDLANGVAMLTEHKTVHHTGKPRLIVLSPTAVELLTVQVKAHPEGPLLRNGKGTPWKKDAIVLAMRRASETAGVKVTAYHLRHTFATQALTKGVPDATVAALLGHSGTAMLHKHYSHLTSQTQVMREALTRVRG